MFHRISWLNWAVAPLLVLTAAGCDGAGCGIAMEPLPPGGVPSDQTVEGAAQIRITSAGFTKLEGVASTLVNDSLGDGFCMPPASALGVTICSTNSGICTPGCQVNMAIDSVDLQAPTLDTLRVAVQFDATSRVHVDGGLLGDCTLDATVSNARVRLDIPLRINPTTGELERPRLRDDDQVGVSIPNPALDGCSFAGDILDAIDGLIIDLMEGQIREIVRTQLDAMLQSLLPDPLGIEGALDIGALLAAVSPKASGRVELRAMPGGFAGTHAGGLTMGAILGVNTDRDPTTRTRDKDNEPARCVPALPAPDLAAAPLSLATTARGTFLLAPAEEFLGAPDPAADVAIGLSESALDLLGHHAVTSGALCLDVGTDLVPQLNLGALGILVPSLGLLGQGDEPLLLATRPVNAIDFTVGEGTADSPSITMHLRDFEVDLYAFLYERFVRAFTLRMSANVGIGLEFTTTADGAAALLPVLSGLEAQNIEISALNAAFLAETEEEIAAVMPTVINLALSTVNGRFAPIEIPAVAGFGLSNLQATKVVTAEDEFVAVLGELATPATSAAAALRQAAPGAGSIGTASASAIDVPPRPQTRAALARVTVPAPERTRAALIAEHDGLGNDPGAALPEVVIDVQAHDPDGRPLEHTWRLNGGMWRTFTGAAPLVIRDPALAVQGRHTIEVRARVAGDYRTLDLGAAAVPVVIDSVAPRILERQARAEAGRLVVPARDLVSPAAAVALAFASPGAIEPSTAWAAGEAGGLPLAQADRLAERGMIQVFARDESDNISTQAVNVSGALATGRGCSAGGGANGLAVLLALAGLCLAHLVRRRRAPAQRRVQVPGVVLALWAAALAGAPLVLGCGGRAAGEMPDDGICEEHAECDAECADGTVGFCLEGQCECLDELPMGRIGQDSAMTLLPGGEVCVSAYNSLYGDLNVVRWSEDGPIANDAWTFVDGVPASPVAVAGGDVRGGVRDAGEDVGRYTSVAAAPGGVVMVSYFDQANASLRLAIQRDGAWDIQTVDPGLAPAGEDAAFTVVGQYSSITVRGDTGAPGIAYFAHVRDADGSVRTEVRYASARTGIPQGPDDWFYYVVDELALSAADQTSPYPIPPGVGLFISSARASDETPVLAYYDRVNGDLKLSRFDRTAGVFMTPEVLDGADGRDVGWYPSIAMDGDDEVHVSYVDATDNDLLYINTIDRGRVVVDDGYREVGTTESGLPKPELHRVGDDSALVLGPNGPVIVYQNATTRELLVAERVGDTFERVRLAGGLGSAGHGFYIAAALDGTDLVVSNWVVDPPSNKAWVELKRWPLALR